MLNEVAPEDSDLRITVDSISCATADPRHLPEILLSQYVSRAIVNRAAEFAEVMHEVGFNKKGISLSFHPARAVDTTNLIVDCESRGIPITSIDTPDTYRFGHLVRDGLKAGVSGQLGGFTRNAGWFLQNVSSFKQQSERMEQALSEVRLAQPRSRPFIRVQAGAWLGSREGQALVDKAKFSNVDMAVEIDAHFQTHAEYWMFVQQLKAYLKRFDIWVGADVDLGHLDESKARHPEVVMNGALAAYESVLQDPRLSKLVILTSLNQYLPGLEHTHSDLITGPIDLKAAVGKLGQAQARGALAYPPLILPEFYPADYDRMVGPEGQRFFKGILGEYHQGRGR